MFPALNVKATRFNDFKPRNDMTRISSPGSPASTLSSPCQSKDTRGYKPFNVKFDPQHLLLPKGHVKETGRKQMLVDSVVDRDTPIPLRDGLHVYADIYRPVSSDETQVPVVICWRPYGKSSISLDGIWHRSGVPKDWTSGYETFEGLDPADWCRRGYAIVNVDARGAQFSEGTFFFWGDQEAEDIYDTIDFLSKQSWCNGSVCMGGNSYLAKAQVSFASRQSHPALKALAPWEGFTDIYRQLLRRGGFAMQNTFIHGANGEDPCFIRDEYWAGKYDEVEKINVPMYLLGSFADPFHVYGSFDTYRRAGSTKKWMRVHANFEWYEMCERSSNDDLQRFFDRYSKGIMNGWEHDTPPLRLSLHGCGSIPNIMERPEIGFPFLRQSLQTYYLDAVTKSLHASPRDRGFSACHDGHGLEAFYIVLKFGEYTEIAGYAKARLWMSCKQKDDMDVVVQLRKIDGSANLLEGVNFPCLVPESEVPPAETSKLFGPQGFLRASSSISRDQARSSTDCQEIFYRHDRAEKISPGTIIPLEITL
ncbi:hypothetical protein N7526_007073 [Penicillium atrosanguineum]|nr:hypothetical protein N7526_007073 [Penicillium atrosanguineum]